MKIAQIAPLIESVPPKVYGGTERVVSYLTEELVRRGHDVTLFASGDSTTSARLVPCCERALRLDSYSRDYLAHSVVMLNKVFEDTSRFDILHFHIDYLHFLLVSRQQTPAITTQHGRMDITDLQSLYNEFPNQSLVSISNHQRNALPQACWIQTVYHGLPEELYHFHHQRGEYLAFLGRLSPEKDPVTAIEIAARLGFPLKIAAKIDPSEQEYFETSIAPLIHKHRRYVEYIGEIGEDEKDEFLGNALALLFPIRWPEPFGLVMIESLACGTPIIACPQGAVPEIIEDGITGFFMETIEEGMAAVERIGEINRQMCRSRFIERFSVKRMADDYLNVYRQVIKSSLQRESYGKR